MSGEQDFAAAIYKDNAKEFVAARQNDAEVNMRAQLAALMDAEGGAGAIPAAPPAVVGGFAIEGLGETPVVSQAAQEDELIKATVLQSAPAAEPVVEPVAEGEPVEGE